MFLYTTIIAGFLIGLPAGAARLRFGRAPWVATALILLAYLALVAAAGTWAARCWDCAHTAEDTRRIVFVIWTIWGGAVAVGGSAGVWVGSALVRRFAR